MLRNVHVANMTNIGSLQNFSAAKFLCLTILQWEDSDYIILFTFLPIIVA